MTRERVPFWRRPIHATRWSAHIVFAAGCWPFLTVIGTSITLLYQPYVSIDEAAAFKASIVGLVLRLPDMALAGLIVFGISGLIFGRLGPIVEPNRVGFARLIVEPMLAFVAVVGGMSISYPAALNTPVLSPFVWWPVWAVVLSLLAASAVGGFLAARPGKRFRLAAAMVVLGLFSPVPLMIATALERFTGHPPDVVVLGLDSISHRDDVKTLKSWTGERQGIWYEYPVAPGLLTNAVWSSILTMKPVSVHHVFHTFERLTIPPAFLSAARARGYHTVAIFPDQVTCSVGSRAGFDEDRSGPVGWRQVLLPAIANNSFLLPIVRPALPRLWPGASPANEAGTFTYDVRRDVRRILRAGSRKKPTLVAAHLTYMHLPAYPMTLDLSLAERWKVARSPVGTIEDRSFDWQDSDKPTDPIQLQAWKLAHLQRVVQSEIDSSGYLQEGRRLVIFSDHGHRLGLNMHSFREDRFHHVLLATFGVPPRCPDAPISLIDIGSLLGLSKTRAEAVVEFAIAPSRIWPQLMETATRRWGGDVDLDPQLLASVRAGLQSHRPWSGLDQRVCRSGPAVP